MSKSGKFNPRRPAKGRNRPNRPQVNIRVRSVKHNPPDLRKLGRAVIAMGLAEMEAEKVSAAEETDTDIATTDEGKEVRDDR
ncbi:hypothetical protein [Nocardia sp. CA-119907]|uniref:hypothetical protein n=1 Tax=Nocardia sp. CA-119907 TaxID=3239973 RepID=UPI003D96A735